MQEQPLLLMNTKNITRDLILLDLYHKNLVFYLAPSIIFLNAIGASVVMNLVLNKKIIIDDDKNIDVIDTTSTRTYNKLVIDYIVENKITSLKKLAQDLFLDVDFSFKIYDLVIKELAEEKVVEVKTEKRLIFNKNTIKLIDPERLRNAYKKLYDSLFKEEQPEELIALAILIDSFFDVNSYFDEEVHDTIEVALEKMKKDKLFSDIKAFKDVVDEFYLLSTQQNGALWL
ncbi:MAG: hypothetical protein LBR40_04815 [Bacilli bacterium]|jgi:MFS superfamily sulfate permease-like transporter|nr:hypothetical protein [Bacilli bacterium]